MLHILKPPQLRLLLPMLLLPSPATLAAQLTFRHAVQLALQRSEAVTVPLPNQNNVDEACGQVHGRYPLEMQANSPMGSSLDSDPSLDSAPLSMHDPTDQWLIHLAPPSSKRSSDAQRENPPPSNDDRHRRAVLCTAVAYIELNKVNSQIEVLRRQEMAAARLLKIEALRVVGRVDDPVRLTRAKLLEARTRMWAVTLESWAGQLRKQLADLTGLPEDKVELTAHSIPLLPDLTTAPPELQASINQVAVRRDVAQLEYALARSTRMKMKVNNVLGTAKLGDLAAAYIVENEKLNLLLEMNFELIRAQLQVLLLTDNLEKWALHDGRSASGLTSAMGSGPVKTSASILPASGSDAPGASPAARSIMITPGVSGLVAGESKQFSAIAIYVNGTAKDATREATWRCTSNSDAIISTSGLVTALATGEVTISATFSGVTESHRITITADQSDALDPH